MGQNVRAHQAEWPSYVNPNGSLHKIPHFCVILSPRLLRAFNLKREQGRWSYYFMSGGVVVVWTWGGGECEGGYESILGGHGGFFRSISGLGTSWSVGFGGSMEGVGGLGGGGCEDVSDFPGCSAEIAGAGAGGRFACMLSIAWRERW